MQKALIISYFFPPCNLTAASRIGSWEKYLPENDIYPIVVTRNWTGKELTEEQRLESSGEQKRFVKKPNSEIHYMPYKASLRDQFFIKGKNNSLFAFLSKLLTFIYLILQNVSLKFIPYNNLYYQAKKLLNEDKEIKTLIISGNPFEQFYFGYLLKKEFPNIKWIADYRDEWTTSEINEFGFFRGKINSLHQYFEKKWISKADLVTANTNYAKSKLISLHGDKCEKLLNGFDEKIANKGQDELTFNQLVIVHNGTLYPTQKLDLLKEALLEIEIPDNFTIKLKFPGIKIKADISNLVEKQFQNVPINLELTDRLPKKEIIEMQQKADVLLMVAHEGKKGIVGSKLYEYLSLEKKVLLCPTDNDELEETLLGSNLGIIINDKKELIIELEKLIKSKIQNGLVNSSPNCEIINTFARSEQVKLLAKYINKI